MKAINKQVVRMKKRRTFITAIAALTAISMGMAGFSGTVWADPEDPVDPPASSSTGSPAGATAISGGYGNVSGENTTFTFNKYLIFDKNARVPNTEFTFSIAPAGISTAHLTEQNVELYNGLTGVVFNDGDDTTANDDKATFTESMTENAKNGGTPAEFTNNKGAGASIGITDEASKKYAVDSVTLDFSAVEFKEPGVYRYIVTETPPTGAYTAETETQRTLDVYVVDKETVKGGSTYTELEIEGYVLYNKVISGAATNFTVETAVSGIGYNAKEIKDDENNKKSSGFVNSYETHNLTIGKEVSGNQASRDKYFAITVEISNATVGDKYTVAVEKGDEDTANGVFANADAAVVANAATTVSGTNVKELTVTADGEEGKGKVTETFYLHDGQYITICGLGKGVSYKVTEAAENYTSKDGIEADLSSLDWNSASGGNDALADLTEGSIGGADIHTGFTNSRSGAIPTGVILSVAAPATIGIVVVAGIIYLVAKRRKDDDSEE
jgi:galactitol-specific phosphotransferase system IIB component